MSTNFQNLHELSRLNKAYDQLHLESQSASNERALTELEFKINAIKYALSSDVERRAEKIFKIYLERGSYTAVLRNGSKLNLSNVEYGGNPVQHIWNVRCAARRLAYDLVHDTSPQDIGKMLCSDEPSSWGKA